MAVLFSLKRGFLANKKKNKANTAQTTIATNLGQRQVTPELRWAYGRLCPFQGETLPLRPISLWLTYCRGNCPHSAFQLFPSRFHHLDVFCQQKGNHPTFLASLKCSYVPLAPCILDTLMNLSLEHLDGKWSKLFNSFSIRK